MNSNLNIPIYQAKSFKSRLFGLTGKKNIDFGIYFPKCNSIHTFFMKEAIDVIGLNQNNQIIFIKQNLLPNKICFIKSKIKKTSILEIPKNTSNNLQLGDELFFEFKNII